MISALLLFTHSKLSCIFFFIKYDKKYVTIKKKKITKNKNYNDSKQNINLLYNRNELHENVFS